VVVFLVYYWNIKLRGEVDEKWTDECKKKEGSRLNGLLPKPLDPRKDGTSHNPLIKRKMEMV
jgi:hypothetical protein